MAATIRAIRDIFVQEHTVEPAVYLKASGEILFLILAVSCTITAFVVPSQFVSNPLTDLLGYNNLCVGFDVPPALYFAAVLFVFVVYFAIKYAVLDTKRAVTLGTVSRSQIVVTAVFNGLYAVSISIVALVFVILPVDDPVVHGMVFLQLVPTRFFAVLGNYYEANSEDISLKSRIFFVIYGALSWSYFIMASYSLNASSPGKHAVNPTLLQVIDYMWFLSVPLTSLFLPEAPLLNITYNIVTKSTEETSTELVPTIDGLKDGAVRDESKVDGEETSGVHKKATCVFNLIRLPYWLAASTVGVLSVLGMWLHGNQMLNAGAYGLFAWLLFFTIITGFQVFVHLLVLMPARLSESFCDAFQTKVPRIAERDSFYKVALPKCNMYLTFLVLVNSGVLAFAVFPMVQNGQLDSDFKTFFGVSIMIHAAVLFLRMLAEVTGNTKRWFSLAWSEARPQQAGEQETELL